MVYVAIAFRCNQVQPIIICMSKNFNTVYNEVFIDYDKNLIKYIPNCPREIDNVQYISQKSYSLGYNILPCDAETCIYPIIVSILEFDTPVDIQKDIFNKINL